MSVGGDEVEHADTSDDEWRENSDRDPHLGIRRTGRHSDGPDPGSLRDQAGASRHHAEEPRYRDARRLRARPARHLPDLRGQPRGRGRGRLRCVLGAGVQALLRPLPRHGPVRPRVSRGDSRGRPRAPRRRARDGARQGAVQQRPVRQHDHAGRRHAPCRHGPRGDEVDHAGGDPSLSRAEPGGPRPRLRSARRRAARLIVIAPAHSRPWHAAWPAHVPRSFDYPRVPAWWLLEQNVPRFGERRAVIELDHDTLVERRALTYEALWRGVRGMAAGLKSQGAGRRSHVGLCLPNSTDLIAGFYATWYAGSVVVPVNPASRQAEIEQQLSDAAVSHLVAPRDSSGARAADKLGIVHVGAEEFRAMEALAPDAPGASDPDDVAVLLYTGGTTGAPKGAMLTHRNIVANTIQFARWYDFEPGGETSFCAIPMYHSGGMSGVMNVPLSAGATLIVVARFHPPAVAEAVGRYRVTRLFGVPTMFIALLGDAAGRRADYSGLRACRTNAAPLPPHVKAEFDALVGRPVLVEGYGLTETSPLTHANPIGRAKAGSIGIPLPDTDARIVDLDAGTEVEPGAPGELLIRGPQVMKGYWQRPDATVEVIRD